MKSNYKRIGDHIERISTKNIDGKLSRLLGIKIDKYFMPSVANVVGTDLSKYKIVHPNQFSCNRMHVGRDFRLPVALSGEDDSFIVSPAYDVFYIKDTSELLPEYLMMWFRRPEFDRETWFHTDTDVRGKLGWEDFCDMTLPVPSITKQQAIVDEYNVITRRISILEQLNAKLEETAQTIYKHWFVDFEFPDENGKPYKTSGGKMVWNEELEKEVPEGISIQSLSELVDLNKEKIHTELLTTKNYISTENMIPNMLGIKKASSIPSESRVANFKKEDILISNIRPYFKKIWFAKFEGGCSNDVLCLRSRGSVKSIFIYQSLKLDSFFDYVMKGAKGTKMPRGDKDWTLNYKLPILKEQEMLLFYKLTNSTYRKVELNNIENKKLFRIKETLLQNLTGL